MKITKRKWENIPPVFIYRDVESGKLFTECDRQQDYTDKLFQDECSASDVFKISLQNRLFRMQKDGKTRVKNEITELVACLCKNTDLRNSINKVKKLPLNVAEKKCNETLSDYGKSFTAEGGTKTLFNALLDLVKGNDEERALAEAELVKIQKILQEEIKHRKKRIYSSIRNNKIPLLIKEDGSIEANSDRTAWLLDLLQPVQSSLQHDSDDFYPVLTEMEKIFDYDKLSNDINRQLTLCDGKTRSIAKAADEVLKKHFHELWENHPDNHRHMKYYFQAVKEYFKENFPIKAKTAGARKRQDLLTDKAVLSRLLEPKHMANVVRRKLINQSTQMHILYGKLYEYCCKGDKRLPVNSDTLQRIQVTEAVKKQVMTAVLWSISRLCYFYQYDGDILNDKNVVDVKDYRENFLVKQYTTAFVQACKEKLQYFFPLDKVQDAYNDENVAILKIIRDDRQLCNKLLKECVTCVKHLRVNIFHYKNMGFAQTLKKISAEIENELDKSTSILLWLYQNDRKNLGKAFANRIRSMNLPLYYSNDLLTRIFTKQGLEFSLYSPNNQMTPSFKRVYERGKNLRSEYERRLIHECTTKGHDVKTSLENECELKWFRQLKNMTVTSESVINTDIKNDITGNIDNESELEMDAFFESETYISADSDAQRALQNLLQLIYKHHFLPEVMKDDTIVTSKVSKVLDRNRTLAVDRSKSDKASDFGYRAVEEIYHDGMKLSELMKELQRKISETEKKNEELEQDKTDYAQRFVRELFAEAFNDFLQERYGEEYYDMMHPQRNERDEKEWINESVNLRTSFDENKIEGYLLVFYTVMRLLDGKELSELQQQMLRFRASMLNWTGEADFDEDIKMIEKIEELAELVRLTEAAPVYTEEVWRKRAKEEFNQLIEGDMSDYGTFYLQTDGSSPVLHRSMLKLMRSGVMGVYRQVLHDRKQATKHDYNIYCDRHWVLMDSDRRMVTFAEYAQRILQELHDKYATSPKCFPQTDHRSYGNILQWIDEYNHAKSNLNFETLYEICSIHMEILSRWVGFVQDWERDMYFLLLAWVKQGKLYGISEEDILSIFEKGKIVSKLKSKLKGGNTNAFFSIYRLDKDKETDFIRVRNDIAHLDLLREKGWTDVENKDCSVMEWYINRLRSLLSYDQKRMNAVTKTMQKIFERHKAEVTFRVERGGKIKFDSVNPVMIEHLKEFKGISVPSRGETFISNLEKLMKYSGR